MKLTVYQRIMRADKNGTGLRLSKDDVGALAMDDAVSMVAALDDDPDPMCGTSNGGVDLTTETNKRYNVPNNVNR